LTVPFGTLLGGLDRHVGSSQQSGVVSPNILYRASSGALVARLRPIGQDDRVEVSYWSLWKERWTKTGPFGRTILPLDQAPKFIASEDIFWAIT
jgi:hypothetical protein